MKKLKSLLAAGILFLSGCATNDFYLTPQQISLEKRVYSVNENVVRQETKDGDIRLGIVADIHNKGSRAEKIAERLGQEDLDGIVIAGDFSNFFVDLINVAEKKQIRNSLEPFLQLRKPVYIIAGNHETKNAYFNVMEELAEEYGNVFDLATLKYVDLQGVNIFGVSGGTMIPLGGFSVDREIDKVDKKVFSLDLDPVLMISHMPPRFNHPGAIDCLYDVVVGKKVIKNRHKGEEAVYELGGLRTRPRNEGINKLTDLIKEGVDFSVSGHYHMNFGANDLYENISENKYSEKLFMNPGAVKYDMAAILTIKGNEAKYDSINIGK